MTDEPRKSRDSVCTKREFVCERFESLVTQVECTLKEAFFFWLNYSIL
jgi:hypothetical protein